jgi:hypothetical protein
VKIANKFSEALSFEEQILYVLSIIKKGSANEIAIELIELKAVAAEEEVADITMHTERSLEKLLKENKVKLLKENHERKRFIIAEPGIDSF